MGRSPHSSEQAAVAAEEDGERQIEAMRERLSRASAAAAFYRMMPLLVPEGDRGVFLKRPDVIDERDIISFLTGHSIVEARLPEALRPTPSPHGR